VGQKGMKVLFVSKIDVYRMYIVRLIEYLPKICKNNCQYSLKLQFFCVNIGIDKK